MDNIETFLTADQRRRILEKVKNRIIKKKGGSICFGLYHVVYEIDPFSAMDYLTYGDSFKKFQQSLKWILKLRKKNLRQPDPARLIGGLLI